MISGNLNSNGKIMYRAKMKFDPFNLLGRAAYQEVGFSGNINDIKDIIKIDHDLIPKQFIDNYYEPNKYSHVPNYNQINRTIAEYEGWPRRRL